MIRSLRSGRFIGLIPRQIHPSILPYPSILLHQPSPVSSFLTSTPQPRVHRTSWARHSSCVCVSIPAKVTFSPQVEHGIFRLWQYLSKWASSSSSTTIAWHWGQGRDLEGGLGGLMCVCSYVCIHVSNSFLPPSSLSLPFYAMIM